MGAWQASSRALSFIPSAHGPSDHGGGWGHVASGSLLWAPSKARGWSSAQTTPTAWGQSQAHGVTPALRAAPLARPGDQPALPHPHEAANFSDLENKGTWMKGGCVYFRWHFQVPSVRCAISCDSLSAPPQSGGLHLMLNSLLGRSRALDRQTRVRGGQAHLVTLGHSPRSAPWPGRGWELSGEGTRDGAWAVVWRGLGTNLALLAER